MSTFALGVRLRVQRQKFYDLRVALGDLRQRTGDRDPRMDRMQLLVGEVENTLRRCERLREQLR